MLTGLRRVVALTPHPDDEIFFAGLLVEAARAGAELAVVCATRGERGPAPPGVSPAELADIRTRELTRSCEILGAAPPIFLDLPDGGVETAGADALIAAAAGALAKLDPDAVVSFGADGGYGHRDHVALAAALAPAAARLEPAPLALAAAFPRGLFAPICRQLRRLHPGPIHPRIAPESLGVARSEAELVVDVAPLSSIKRDLAAAHRSQLPAGDPDNFLAPGLLAELCREEWYQVVSRPGGAP